MAPRRRARAGARALAALLAFACAPAPAMPESPASAPADAWVNWAVAPLGAFPLASGAGAWAGYYSSADKAMDGDPGSFWSDSGARCCSESSQSWLLLSLGAPRPVAAVELWTDLDLSYTVQLANNSAGPFYVVGTRSCSACVSRTWPSAVPDVAAPVAARHLMAPTPRVASHVKISITWSSAGGPTACAGAPCAFASTLFEVRALGPGTTPLPALPPPSPPATPPPPAVCNASAVPVAVAAIFAAEPGNGSLSTGPPLPFTLRLGAAVVAGGAPGTPGDRVQLTPAELTQRTGLIEFTTVFDRDATCGCSGGRLVLSLNVSLGGGAATGGEGMVVSLVDAELQSPGKAALLPGCGLRSVTPADALTLQLDTYDNAGDAGACAALGGIDGAGTGMRLVSTLGGAYTILGATLGPTAWFRHGDWLALQLLVPTASNAAWSPLVYVGGALTLVNRRAALLPRRFFVLAAARTSGGTHDEHSVASVRLDCAPLGWVPDIHPPWHTPAPAPAATAAGRRGGYSGGATFAGACAFLLGVAGLVAGSYIFLRRRRRARAADGGGGSVPFKAAPGDLYITASRSWERLEEAPADAESQPAYSRPSIMPPALPTDPLSVDFAPAGGSVQEGVQFDPVSAALGGATAFMFDVFLSYRRLDGRLVDAVQDKLLLNRLRVFKDVNGHMAGRPFDVELFRVIRDSAVFAPVITLEGMRRLALLRPDQADFTLAEYITALYFFEAGDIPLVYPLAVGAESVNSQGKAEWDKLFDNPVFKRYRDELPDVVPTATLNLVNGTFLKILGHALPAQFSTLTIREVMLGRLGDASNPALAGLFSFDLYFLMCLQEDLSLHIEGRFARNIRAALAQAERRGWRRRVRPALPDPFEPPPPAASAPPPDA